MAIPAASATWFSKGSYEPDTDCDSTGCKETAPGVYEVAGGYMHQDPDITAAGLKIYFNGYAASDSTVNPNSEITGSRINPTGQMRFHAYLGIWKDCNDDGYIGAANSAVLIYSADLADDTICPDGSQFNRNGWVYEFIWIGHGGHRAGDVNYPSADDQRWINDTESKVWLDFGRPGDAPGGSCPINPQPRGTFSSTGGLLRYGDCFTSRRVFATADTVDPDRSLGIRPADQHSWHNSSTILGQDFPVNLWGNPNAGADHNTHQTGVLEENTETSAGGENRAFHVWDCSKPEETVVTSPVSEVEDPTGGELSEDGKITLFADGTVVKLAAVSPRVSSTPLSSSWYDAINGTERGMHNAQSGGGAGGNADNCDSAHTSDGSDALCSSGNTTTWCLIGGFSPEGDVAPTAAAKRVANDEFSFNFGGGGPPRGRQLGNIRVGDSINDGDVVNADPRNDTLFAINPEDELQNNTGSDTGGHLNATLGKGYHHGLHARGAVIINPGWGAITSWANTAVTINRATLEPESGQYRTYYAKIGAATIATTAVTAKNNVASVYGFEWCAGATTGVVKGFDCDATNWYNTTMGADAMPTGADGTDLGPKAGEAYHLRDIDCYDNKLVRGTEVYAGIVQLSPGGPCKDSSI